MLKRKQLVGVSSRFARAAGLTGVVLFALVASGFLRSAVVEAAQKAAPGDVVLLSPACSSFDQFQNYAHRGEVFRQAVQNLQVSRPAPSGGAHTRLDSGPTGSRNVNPLNVGASGRPRSCTEVRL